MSYFKAFAVFSIGKPHHGFIDLDVLSDLTSLWHASVELESTATSLSISIYATVASNDYSRLLKFSSFSNSLHLFCKGVTHLPVFQFQIQKFYPVNTCLDMLHVFF